MSSWDITSANSVFTMTAGSLIPVPFVLSQYSADRAFEAESVESAETQMTIDGKLLGGWVPNPFNMTIQLAASSDSYAMFEMIAEYERVQMTKLRLGALISLPSIGRKFTLNGGFLLSIVPLPSAGRVLDARPVQIRWESCVGAAL
ncbi:phage tail fiber protein [Nguyenibacter vanlangensis]|uniref:Uncharacterized protein n=1 Tax=Nguyenibacter vanlangensis TaxID=1216886 RepID=A0A7Y7ISU1_9PROT|nr:hypothetical protein [Nguyenibacter vanlangensis]NVN09709.1 hypothetical protein [Nguyenibacter vanlangensis]